MSISISDITTGSIQGTGDFDVLVRAAKEHLLLEYTSNRITGDKYAEAYIAIVNQVLAMAIQFRVQSEQINVQSLLTDEQKALIKAQTAQVIAETLNVPKQGLVLDKQVLQIDKQIAQLDAELLNIPKQGVILDKQASQIEKQVTQLDAEILNIPKQGILLDKQASNLDVDIQVKTKDIALRESNIKLTDQKTKTEMAQTLDLIDGTAVKGTVGKQKEVYDAQIKGFKDDALQKATKTMTDIWSVQRSTDTGIQPTTETKLYDSNIGSAVSSLFTSLGISVAPVPLAAFVSAVSSVTGSEVVQTGENLAISGNMGDNGSSIISITVRDTNSKVVQATNTTTNNKSFTAAITAANIATLAKGDLVVTTRIRTTSGGEISVSDGATKGY